MVESQLSSVEDCDEVTGETCAWEAYVAAVLDCLNSNDEMRTTVQNRLF